MEPPNTWNESDSQHFLDIGRIYTPARDEIGEVILDLIPAEGDEPFLAVELGVGAGWLSTAILERFSAARVLGLDGSPTMLREAGSALARFPGRAELRPFQLEDSRWLDAIEGEVRCFVSSLVIHHLDGPGKQALYRLLHDRLSNGGALLFADLVAPNSERERRYLARSWDEEVKRQSLAFTGSLDVYQQFATEDWNWYDHPDPFDKPSAVPEHLRWLQEADFTGSNVFWERAGHAVYGGYRSRAL
ncbi:MAG: class I SAM-dependent methyltransferase [Chloroflexota bacterium]|nr:class I SAM-dependent methyltransferase [Chloroflexota bacterium]